MSLAAMMAVFRLDLPPLRKWILICLADNADDFGESIFPKISTISQKSSIPERTLQRHLKALVHEGVLEVARPARRPTESRPGRGTEYRLAFMARPMASAPKPNYANCPPALRLQVIEVFGQTCTYCSKPGDEKLGPDGKPWHVDRIVPGSRGGNYVPANITLSCSSCNMSKGAKLAPESVTNMGAKLKETGAKTIGTGAAIVAPDPSLDPSIDPKTNVSRASQVRTAFDFWKVHLNHPNAILDGKRERAIDSRLKQGFTLESVLLGIRGCKLTPFNMGQNPANRVYDDIELICRDAKHLEEFIAAAQKASQASGWTTRPGENEEQKKIRENCQRCFGTSTELVPGQGARFCRHEPIAA